MRDEKKDLEQFVLIQAALRMDTPALSILGVSVLLELEHRIGSVEEVARVLVKTQDEIGKVMAEAAAESESAAATVSTEIPSLRGGIMIRPDGKLH